MTCWIIYLKTIWGFPFDNVIPHTHIERDVTLPVVHLIINCSSCRKSKPHSTTECHSENVSM